MKAPRSGPPAVSSAQRSAQPQRDVTRDQSSRREFCLPISVGEVMELIVGSNGTHPEAELKPPALGAGSGDRADFGASLSCHQTKPSEFKRHRTDRDDFIKREIKRVKWWTHKQSMINSEHCS